MVDTEGNDERYIYMLDGIKEQNKEKESYSLNFHMYPQIYVLTSWSPRWGFLVMSKSWENGLMDMVGEYYVLN